MADQKQVFQVAVPSSQYEVEELIQELYRPGLPQKIAKIQETLQQLQRSPEGWQLATLLLDSNDDKVKFFGALTLTVKLNTDSESLTPEDAEQLLMRLISWLLQSVTSGAGAMVIRKLCSTLVVYFLHFSGTWTQCIRHLVYCLSTQQSSPISALERARDIQTLISTLSAGSLQVILWFSTTLAEEIGKTDANSIRHHQFHGRLRLNVDDVVALISLCLNDSSGQYTNAVVRQDAMKCYHSWVLYSHRAFIDGAEGLEPLRSLANTAMGCLLLEDMYPPTIELFCDVLGNYSRFLYDEDLNLLSDLFVSGWADEKRQQLLQGDFGFESLQFGQFLIAYGDATVQDLAKKTDGKSQQILSSLGSLLKADGYGVEEDLIFVQALEFWSTFVEVLVDALYSDDEADRTWTAESKSQVFSVVESCWRKIQFPPAHEFDQWESTDRVGFADARKDVADLLQSTYPLAGNTLFSRFASLAMEALSTRAWSELEASLYCLGSLADYLTDETECDSILAQVFGSPLFSVLADPASQVPARTRQTALSLIGQYDGYFERHTHHLPSALTFLFQAIASPDLAGTASRSIHSLCSACRQVLVHETGAFLQQYSELSRAHTVDGLVKERVVGAIASIIQAFPVEQDKLGPLSQLVELIELDGIQCLTLPSEVAEQEALDVLRCLTSIAKGLQSLNEGPIDLENTNTTVDAESYWVAGEGAVVQSRVISIVQKLLATFSSSGDVMEATCNMFCAGFVETVAGPFVFSSDLVTQFVINTTPQTPRLGAFISTACAFVSSSYSSNTKLSDETMNNILAWLFGILQNLEDPSEDPEIAQLGIEFVCRLLSFYVRILTTNSSSSLEHFFMFSLKALTGKDPLPKIAAADFWSSFVSLNNETTNNTMQQLGPLLAQALIYNISGNAARSELDKIADPLKKLAVKQVNAKAWLEKALSEDGISSTKTSESDKRVFLQKIIALRGKRETNQVIKDYWLACRGSNFAYAS